LNVDPNKSSLIKVFSTKNKDTALDENLNSNKLGDNKNNDKRNKNSQDLIDTNVESDPEYDSTLNINIKKEVDILKLIKTEEQSDQTKVETDSNHKNTNKINGKITLFKKNKVNN